MNSYFMQNIPRFYGVISLLSIFFAVIVEFEGNVPKFIALLLPLAGLFVMYNLSLLLAASNRVRQFIFSSKGGFSLLCLISYLFLTCTPAIDLSHIRNHPFKNYHWLTVSLIGILFSLSFLNCAILRPQGLGENIVCLCKKVWGLPVKYFLLIYFLWVFVITSFFSFAVFEHIPHVQDEIAQLFQAKIFARGSLTAPLPPIADFFQYFYDNIIVKNRWYSEYTPGHPFLLMFGVLLGIPWIINPFFASCSVPILYLFARDYYGEKEARLSVILYSVSPFVLFMSASFMNHVTSVFFLILFLFSLNKTIMKRNGIYATLAGFALGAICNIRAGDAFAMGILFVTLFFIYAISKGMYREGIMFTTALSCIVGILLLYNYATNGDPLLFGSQVRWGTEHSIGFSSVSVMGRPAHTPLRGLLYTLRNFIALNQNLFEWPFPSLLPLIIFWMPFLFRKNKKDYFLLCGFLAAPVFYFFYFFQDLCLGARFYYISLPFILLLTSRAVFSMIDGIAVLRKCPKHYVKNAFIALFFLSIIFSSAIRVPKLWRYYSDSFWEVDNQLMKKVYELGITNAVIFQKSYGYKGNGLGSGFLHNSPWLDTPIIFVRDLGERNASFAFYFPKKNCYLASRDDRGEVIIELLNIADKKSK
jgi:hypothetical protein